MTTTAHPPTDPRVLDQLDALRRLHVCTLTVINAVQATPTNPAVLDSLTSRLEALTDNVIDAGDNDNPLPVTLIDEAEEAQPVHSPNYWQGLVNELVLIFANAAPGATRSAALLELRRMAADADANGGQLQL